MIISRKSRWIGVLISSFALYFVFSVLLFIGFSSSKKSCNYEIVDTNCIIINHYVVENNGIIEIESKNITSNITIIENENPIKIPCLLNIDYPIDSYIPCYYNKNDPNNLVIRYSCFYGFYVVMSIISFIPFCGWIYYVISIIKKDSYEIISN